LTSASASTIKMDMDFKNRCNGYSFAAIKFGEGTVATFKMRLGMNRERFIDYMATPAAKQDDKYDAGSRFFNDMTVLGRIESAASEAEFLADPDAWTLDALRDCASSDYYYNYEKSWD
jgi:hypothetical protein